MPYLQNNDLPKSIQDNLPQTAQTIFREAFNAAHEHYGDEEQAFRVAWSAVKKEYVKREDGQWVKKS